jgi:hypothetical protein
MNRKFVLLNLLLLVAAGLLGWRLRMRWIEARAHERELIRRAAEPKPLPLPPPPAQVKPVTAVEYMDVAQRDLFAKDRNPNVIVEVVAPPAPPPPPPMPPLPQYYGQMNWGDPVVFLSAKAGEQKRYHTGDAVGPFKLVSFNLENITFDWNGKNVEKKVEDLAPKETVQAQPLQRAAVAAPQPSAPQGKSLSSDAASLDSNKSPVFGNDMGSGFFGCATGDTSPAGTIVNGYQKKITQGLMGKSCFWEQVK